MQSLREREVWVHESELITVLGTQFEFLWYFARKMGKCTCCGGQPDKKQPYRAFINGHGDFVVYNACGHCRYPISFYVEMSQEPEVNRSIFRYWLGKLN